MQGTQATQQILKSFQNRDPHSSGVMVALHSVYPAFAKKVFEGNAFIQQIVMSGYNMMNILDYPICGRCETIAAYNETGIKDGKRYRRATCMKPGCGAHTVNPITFREWIAMELIHRVPPAFLDTIENTVDDIALSMMRKVQQDIQRQMSRETPEKNAKMGLDVPVQHTHNVRETISYAERVESEPELEPDETYIKAQEDITDGD